MVRKCKGTCDYDFLFTDKETAVMWSKNDFRGEPVDAAVKRRSFDTVVASQNFNSGVSEIPARTSVVKLTSKGDEACSVLGVSWHGPHSATGQKKTGCLERPLSLFERDMSEDECILNYYRRRLQLEHFRREWLTRIERVLSKL